MDKNIPYKELVGLVSTAIKTIGADEEVSICVAKNLVDAEICGYPSHGITLLKTYSKDISHGLIKPKRKFKISRSKGAITEIDGMWAWPQFAVKKGTELGVKSAREHGISLVLYHNLNHAGRLGGYLDEAVKNDCIGIMSQASGLIESDALVSGPDGGIRLLGTNPLTIAIPRPNNNHFLFDASTSAISYFDAISRGKNDLRFLTQLFSDKDGYPSSDSSVLLEKGSILPAAGHKGFGISLGLCLIAALCGYDKNQNGLKGIFQIFISPAYTSNGNRFEKRIERFLENFKDDIHVPGEKILSRREDALRYGVRISDEAEDALRELTSPASLSR